MTPTGEVAHLIEPAWLRPHHSMLATTRRRNDRHPVPGLPHPTLHGTWRRHARVLTLNPSEPPHARPTTKP